MMWRTIRFTPLKVESKKQRVEHYYEGNTLAFVAASGLAQAPPKYDPATEMKVKGLTES